jgi:hypothetical protein
MARVVLDQRAAPIVGDGWITSEDGKTAFTDSVLTKKRNILQKQGEAVFRLLAPKLNKLQPGRERTEEEFQQVCIALGMFLHHLLSNWGEDCDICS